MRLLWMMPRRNHKDDLGLEFVMISLGLHLQSGLPCQDCSSFLHNCFFALYYTTQL